MSFKLFIYYCALCGAWAALIAWLLVVVVGLNADPEGLLTTNEYKWKWVLKATLTGGLLGILLAMAVATLDALLNSVGFERVIRPVVALVIGFIGGMMGAGLGEILFRFTPLPKFPGWVLAGTAIGISIGVFDVMRSMAAGGMGMAIRKIINGTIGGFLGGLVGGVLFDILSSETFKTYVPMPSASLALGFVILGACIGLLIGAAQVILKEAWVRVEAGFRSGRELILSKEVTTIGRAESCDIGLFGDNAIEKMHARIKVRDNRYMLLDDDTPGGTYLNGQRIDGPTPLRSGDRIGVGRAILRFGERQKR